MNRHYYDRPHLQSYFRRERSGFEKVLGTIGAVAHTVGAVAHTVGAVKHTVDVIKGKVPPLPPRPYPYYGLGSYAFRSWTALPPYRVRPLDNWRRHSFGSFAHRISERMHHHAPSLAMTMHHNRGHFGR